VDLSIDVDSIAKFGPTSLMEQHFYPSSLKFNLTIVSGEGLTVATHLGLQRKVLAELSRPSSLVQPSELYQFCLLSGLATGPQLEPSLLTQRKVLLTVVLEQSMVGVIVAAVRDWADGRYSKAGCSLKFLLDWAWDRVVAIKELIDSQTVPLFDHSLLEVDEGARGTLVSLSGQLAQLVTVLSALASSSGVITLVGQEQLECKLNVTGLILLYTQAISWFVNVGLLPEQSEGPGNPFPVSMLEKQYKDKRTRLAGLQGHFGRPGLMVDILCEDIGDDLICSFQKAGGTGAYPPPSLHSLITTFLSESPAPAKLRLVQYFFLDLAHLLPPDQFPDLVDNLIKFPSAFSLPPSVIKLTQAFWLLDHEDWEEAVSMMLDPLLQEDDLTPTHHRAILISLLAQSQATLALKYTRIRRPPCMLPQDVSLHTSVLLANGAIQEAFTFQRSRRGTASSSNILAQFYRKAEELGKLDAVLQLSLTSYEEKEFVSFLQASKRIDSQEVLLMYYLQRSRFTEAMQLNQGLKTSGKGGNSAREAIMDRYNHILPGLANTLGTRRVTLTSAHGMCTRPVPLSVTLQDRNIRLSSHASAIEAKLSTPVNSRVDTQATPFRVKGKRGEREGIVRPTDVTHSFKRKADDEPTICFPNETFQDSSLLSSTKLHATNLVSPPRKRTRLSDVSTLNMSVKSMRRMSRYMTAEAITILSTPTITKVRKAAPSGKNDISMAPASILKVKQLIKETAPAVEGEKILDVSLSLDQTPVVGSRDTTPTKSLRFKEPTKNPSNLTKKPVQEAVTTDIIANPDDSELSNDTNDSFHSFNNSGQMDVDSPIRPTASGPPRSAAVIVDSPLVSKSFGGRLSIGTLSGDATPSSLLGESEKVTKSSFSSHTVSVSIIEEGKTVSEESRNVKSEISFTSVSPSTKNKLEEVLKKAEEKLKEKESTVLEIEEEFVKETAEKPSGLLGAKDLILKLDGDDSQDSDIFMHGKSWERSISSNTELINEENKEAQENEDNDEEDYESEDDKYYDNKVFEKKVCNIVLEDSEDSKDSVGRGDGKSVIESHEVTVPDDGGKNCEVIVDITEDEANTKSDPEVEELDNDESESEESKDLNYSWAQQGNLDKHERQSRIADEIKKLVSEEEEAIKNTEVTEEEESLIIEDEDAVEDTVKTMGESSSNTNEEKIKLSTIDLDESAEEKVIPELNFSTDNDDSMEVDEVIEIDSDEEQDVNYDDLEARGQEKLAFSSLFSNSSQGSDGELEVSNVESKNESAKAEEEELVIVEDSSNSTDKIEFASAPVAEAGSVLFSTFGNDDENASDKISVEVDDVVEVDKKSKKLEVDSKVGNPTNVLLVQDSEEVEQEDEEEDEPIFFEEYHPLDLEADFFSPGTRVRKVNTSGPGIASYSYDVTSSEVEEDRRPTERKETEEVIRHQTCENPMNLVQQIIAEVSQKEQEDPTEKSTLERDPEKSLVASEVETVKDIAPVHEKQPLDTESEQYDKLELRNRTVTETLSPVTEFRQEALPVVSDTEKYDKLELRNRTVVETLSLVSDFGQDSEKSVIAEEEEDDMRELLDQVSTTATRASSIAGSIFGEARAGSVSGSVFGDAPPGQGSTFSFSEPGHLDQSEGSHDNQESRLNFNFSLPLDSSMVDCEEDGKRELQQSKLAFEASFHSPKGNASEDATVEESEDDGEEESGEEQTKEYGKQEDEGPGNKEVDSEEDEDSAEDSEDDQEGGLEFSWTKIPLQDPVNVSDLVSEEIQSQSTNVFALNTSPKSGFLFGKPELGPLEPRNQDSVAQIIFSEPIVEAENEEVDLNNSQFEFEEPLDESIDMGVESNEKESGAELGEVMATPSKTEKVELPLRRSTRKASRDEDTLAKSETIPHHVTRSTRKTPAKNTPTKKATSKVISENKLDLTSGSPNLERPKKEAISSETKPESLASTEPLVSDTEERVAKMASEETPPESIRRKGRPKRGVQEKTGSLLSESRMDFTSHSTEPHLSKAATVPMSTETEPRSSQVSTEVNKTAITADLEDLALTSTTAPATPVRRSRRLSGVTPLITPTLERSRRASGATTGEVKPLSLGAKYDQLELRNRTVTETMSLVSDFGQERGTDNVNKTEKFDTLELRSRTVTETLSLTENFGNKSEGIKSTTPTEALTSVGQRKSRRRSTNLTPDHSPVSLSVIKPSPKGTKSSPLSASSMSVSPKESPKRTTRRTAKALVSPEAQEAPTMASAIPKHLTPLKKVSTPKEESQLTPTRRSRRVSSGDIGSGEPLTPTRRSRRLSGAMAESLDSAPDGGLITGGTPRKTPSTPRNRRHTSVRPEDVESALAIAGGTPLPTLVEEEEREDSIDKEEEIKEPIPVKTRGRKAVSKPSNPSLNVISEDDNTKEETDDRLADVSSTESEQTGSFTMKTRPKRKDIEQLTPEAPPKRRSRRVTITTLGTDVDLFTPGGVSEAGSSRRESTGGKRMSTKKYVPVKKKTSVRIK